MAGSGFTAGNIVPIEYGFKYTAEGLTALAGQSHSARALCERFGGKVVNDTCSHCRPHIEGPKPDGNAEGEDVGSAGAEITPRAMLQSAFNQRKKKTPEGEFTLASPVSPWQATGFVQYRTKQVPFLPTVSGRLTRESSWGWLPAVTKAVFQPRASSRRGDLAKGQNLLNGHFGRLVGVLGRGPIRTVGLECDKRSGCE